jgi:glucan phosphoethanolaminetransferase (alkaline phosphatase superfamily)
MKRGIVLDETERVAWLLRAIVLLLSLQFLFGIWVNLFGTFPATNDVQTAVRYGGDPVLTGHYVLAVVLLVLAIVLVYRTFRPGVRASLRWLSLGGLLSVLWAAVAGVEFILSGFSNNDDSFSMAFAFIVAMTFYGLAQAALLPRTPKAGRSDEGVPVPHT